MKKIGKIIISIIILTIFFCQITLAANLGEKNSAGIVVAIYKNKEYIALNVTDEAFQNGKVLEWSKWNSGDLITIKYRYDQNNNFGRHWSDEEQEFKDHDWYSLGFIIEFRKRIDRGEIVVTGETTSDDSEGQVDQTYKVAEDMNEGDKKEAEKYEDKNKDTEEYKNYKPYKIVTYLETHEYKCPKGCFEIWKETLRQAIIRAKESSNSDTYNRYKKVFEKTFGTSVETTDGEVAIYTNPERKESKTSASSLDDMISDADAFAKQGKIQYEEGELKKFSTILFNSFLAVGVAVALVVGIIIGSKYMMGSIEEKAQYKEMLVPYVVGCFVIFGAFGIWKLVIVILESM